MKALQRLTLLLPVLLGAAAPAAAELQPELAFGSLPLVQPSYPLGSTVALLADGGYAVVWRGDGRAQARLQWVRPDGTEALEPGGRPLPRPLADEAVPVVAARPAGGAFVALAARTERGAQVFVQAFDAAATPLWAPRGAPALPARPGEVQTGPRLLAAGGGGVFVCFLSSPAQQDAVREIGCQRFDADGLPRNPGGWRTDAATDNTSFSGLSLIADGRGGAFVFWTVQHGSSLSVRGQHFSPGGAPLWEAGGRRLRSLPFVSSAVSAVPDGRGGAILAFAQTRPIGTEDAVFSVGAQRFDAAGEPQWGKGVTLPDGELVDSVAPAPDGGAFVVVQQILPVTQTQLILFRLGAGGQLLRPASGVVLSARNRAQVDSGSQVSFDAGRLRILWTSHLQGETFGTEVRIAVFDRNGRRLTARDAPPLVAAGALEAQVFAGFAFDRERDRGLVLWGSFDGPLASPAYRLVGALVSGDTGVTETP
jgi:hypothetical protein